jgi:hypothetical protein
MIQMSESILRQQSGTYRLPKSESESGRFIYYNEKRLDQFLEQGMKMKKDFLSKLEEVKKSGENDEEEKIEIVETGDIQDIRDSRLEPLIKQINSDGRSLPTKSLVSESSIHFDQMSWEEYLQKYSPDNGDAISAIKRFSFPFTGARASEISALYMLRESFQFGGFIEMVEDTELMKI